MIRVRGVTKEYGTQRVLGPIDLDLESGGVTALVGPNGAGKSTLLTIMGRLLEPTAGTVTIDDYDTRFTPSADLAKVVSVLRQENHFVSRLTVRQLVSLGRFPQSRGRLTAEDNMQIESALSFSSLTALEHRFIDELSGGQRQRAYVAMVLAQNTEYVLLDEPLNNLDIGHAVTMMRQIRRAAEELGRTFVIVIHDINFASAYADRIVALVGGRTRFVGPAAQMVTEQHLADTFGTPFVVREGSDYPLADYYRVD